VYDVAEASFRRALALEPANSDALAQLGFILGERGQLAEAEQLLRRARALQPGHFYANYDLGRLLVKAGRYDEAIPVLQHAAELRPNNASVHYQLFLAFSRLKRKDEAERELALFRRLDEERKARERSGQATEDEIEDGARDAQSPTP
jgi:Flp pilus assembly protein TadD